MRKEESEISKVIIDCAITAHKTLGGPGLLESVYEEALAWELEQKGLNIKRQFDCPIIYKGNKLSNNLRIDLMVEDLVII